MQKNPKNNQSCHAVIEVIRASSVYVVDWHRATALLCSWGAVVQEVERQPLQSAVRSVPGQHTDPQIAPEGISVWVYVWVFTAPNEQVAP